MYKKLFEPRIFFIIILIGTTFITSISIFDERVFAEPMLFVKADCRVAQTDIPGEFNASGFEANTSVTIDANKNNNSLGMYPTEPVTVFNTKDTDSMGNVNGSFVLNSRIGPREYSEYFLHVIQIDNPRNFAKTSLNIC